jgi:ABC-type nitrate/sulfonate/bicarbonate transport system permease component
MAVTGRDLRPVPRGLLTGPAVGFLLGSYVLVTRIPRVFLPALVFARVTSALAAVPVAILLQILGETHAARAAESR